MDQAMELWTEYEGRTIDGAYPLTKLLQPEGRSAFFSTSNGAGEQTIIRLIESHYDDDEILSRWRGIGALDHPNLVRLKRFGSVVVDETSLLYAVIEPVDANLAEIVSQRSLAPDEARDLAVSMVAALEALHANGFVHEHLATHTVLAVGETIKLRSDCIRETPEGEEGRLLKQRDVRDLSLILLEALTQNRSLDVLHGSLPAPFDEIVRNGITGDWGLTEISNALAGGFSAKPLPSAVTNPPSVNEAPPIASKVIEMPSRIEGRRNFPRNTAAPSRSGAVMWCVLAVAVLVAVVFGRYLMHQATPSPSSGNKAVAVQSSLVTTPAAEKDQTPAAAAPPAPAQDDHVAVEPVAAEKQVWRVVAFTYNHQDQAQHKVGMISERNPNLKPEVFAPNGRAPYLVTIGGAMSREEAFAFAKKAHREGVARDAYAQNYHE